MTDTLRTPEAESRRERRRKGEGKAPWQPIILPDDDSEEQSPRPAANQAPLASTSSVLRFDPVVLPPAAFRRLAARMQAAQQRLQARHAAGVAGPSGRAPSTSATIDLTDDCVVIDEKPGSATSSARGVKRRLQVPGVDVSSLPPALRPGFKEPPPKPDKEVKFTCSICLENMREEATTICGHIFCKQCIVDSIKATKKCPTCRRKLSVKDVHRIYLQSSAT